MAKSGGMGELADQVEAETDKALADQELEVLKDTSTDLEALRPKIADQATYDKLISVIETSTANNESLAQLKERIEALGSGAVALTRKVLDLVG